jgi:hypothetical protein
VVEAESEQAVRSIGLADPAITSELSRFEVSAMPEAIVGQQVAA